MNDKIQLAAMGDELRLTDEQAKRLAEMMPRTGVLQVIDDEPLCMAKRIEELEAQVRVMAGLLRESTEWMDDHPAMPNSSRMHEALSGMLLSPTAPEGWQLVPTSPTQEMVERGLMAAVYEGDSASCILASAYRAMLAAAPKPEAK